MSEPSPVQEQPLPPNYRRNTIAFAGDWICFGVAYSFVSVSTVLPALVDRLSGSPLAVGLVSTLASGGWLLPQMLAANRVNRLPRKKPAIIVPSLIGRPMFLISGLAILWLAVPNPGLAAAIFLAAFAIFNICDGIASVPWFDLFSRAIPPRRRGRFIGTTQVVAAVMATGVGGIVGFVLGDSSPFQYPANYAALFLAAFAFMGISLLFTFSIHETPSETTGPSLTLRDYLRELKGIWVGDRDFRLISGIRLLLGFSSMASPFYVVYAINVKGIPTGTLGLFLSAQIAGGFLYSIGGGYLLERYGGRLTTRMQTVMGLMAPMLAVVAAYLLPGDSAWFKVVYLLVFASLGALNNSFMLGHMNYLLEMSPEDKRPIYVGLSNTLTGIVIVIPLLGGMLVELVSYEPLYILTVVCIAPAMALAARLSEPRRRGATAGESQ